MALPQRLEHAAALDAGKLLVVAGENEFRAGLLRGGRDAGELLRRNHRRLVHDQNRVAVPARPAFLERVHFAGDGVGLLEAVATHLLDDVIRPSQADDVLAFGLVDGAHGFQRVALAGSGLAPKHGKALRAGQVRARPRPVPASR